MADVFELKYDINLDYSKSLKTMEGEIGNFDIKIPIDIDSKDLDKIKKQVDSLEKKPQKISIQLDAKSYDKQLDNLLNQGNKHAKTIGKNFSAAIREGMQEEEINLSSLIKTGGAKVKPKDVRDFVDSITGIIDKDLSNFSGDYKDLVKYAEELEHVRNILVAIKNDATYGGAIKGGSKKNLDWIEGLIGKIDTKYTDDIGNILKGNKDIFAKQVQDMFDFAKERIKDLSRSLKDGLEFSAMGENIEEGIKEVFGRVVQGYATEIDKATKTIEDKTKELEKEKEKLKRALSVGDTASSAFFDKNKNLLQKIFEAELGKINSKEMQEKSEKEIKEFYKYIISLNNLYESKGLRTDKLTITSEDGTKVRGDKLVEQAYNSLSDTQLSKIKTLETVQSPLIKEYFENQAKEIQAGVDKLEETISHLKSGLSNYYQQAIDEIAKKRDQLTQKLKENPVEETKPEESKSKSKDTEKDKGKAPEVKKIEEETAQISEAVQKEIETLRNAKKQLENEKSDLINNQKASLGRFVRNLNKAFAVDVPDIKEDTFSAIFDEYIKSINLDDLKSVTKEAKKYILDLYETLTRSHSEGGVGATDKTKSKYTDIVNKIRESLGEEYDASPIRRLDEQFVKSKNEEFEALVNKIKQVEQQINDTQQRINKLLQSGKEVVKETEPKETEPKETGTRETVPVHVDTAKLVADMQKAFDETTFQITITLSEASKATLDAIKNAFKDIPVDIKQSEKEGGNTVTVTANGTALRTSIENILKDEKSTFDIDIIPKQGLRAKIVDEISKQEQPFDIFTNIASDVRQQIKDKIGTDPFDISTKVLANIKEQISNLIGETIPINIKPIMPQKPERTNKTTITRERANGDTVTTESSQTTGGAATATSNIDNSFNRGTDNVNKYDNAVGSLLESLRKVGTEIDKIATKSSKVAKVDVVDEQEIDQVYRLGELLKPDKFATTAPATKLKEAFKEFNAYLVKGENLNNLSQAGTIAAYKYFKAFEEALKKHGGKNVAESTLKEFTIKKYIDGFTGQSEFFKKVKGADDKDVYMMTDKLKQNIDDLTTSLKNMRTMYDYIFEKHGAWDFSKLAPNFKTFKDMDGYMKYYLGLFQQVEEIKQRLTGDSRESELQAVNNKIEKYKVNMDRVLTDLEGKDKSDSISSLISDIDQVKQHIESLNAESEPIITQQEKDQTIMALDEIIAKVESVGDSFGKGFNTEQMLASLNNMKTQVSNMDTSLIASDGSIQLPVNITFSFEKFYKELKDKLEQAEELKPKLTIDGIEQLEQLKTLINEELPKAVTDVVSKFSSISADIKTQADAFKNLSDQIKEANAQLTAFITNQNKKNFSLKEVKVKFENIAKAKQDLDKQLEKVNSSIAVKPIVDDKAFKNVQNKIDELKNQLHDFYSKVNPIQSIKLDEPTMQTILAKYQRYLQQFQETGDKNAFINALAQKPTKLNKINTFDVEELRKVARRIIPSDARQGADINKMTKSELARIIGESESQNLFLNEEFRQITTLLSTHIPNALKTMVDAFTNAETQIVQIMSNMRDAISPIESAITTMSTQNFIDPVRMSEIFRQLNNVLKNDDVKRVVNNLEQIRSKFKDFYEMDLSKSNIFTTIDNILKKSEELNKLMEVLKKQADVRQTARDTKANAKTQSEIDKEREIAQSKSEAINERIKHMQEEELNRNNEILVSIVKMKDAYDNLTSAIITTQKVNEQGQFLGVNRYSIGARKDPDSENEDDYITYTTTVNEEQYKKYIDDYLNKYKSFVSEYISLQNKMDSVRQNGGIVDDTVIKRFQFLRSEIMQMAEAFAELNDVSDDALDKFNKTNVGLNIDLNMRDTKIDRRRERERERQEQIYTRDEEAWDRQRTTTQQRTTRNAINTLTTEQANAEKEAMNNVVKVMSQYEEVSKRIARDKALAGDMQEADRLQDKVYMLVDSFKELYSAKGHEKLITMLDEIEARLDIIRRTTQATSYEKEWARHIRELEKEHKESVKQIERQDKKDWSDELSEYKRLISEYVKIRKDLANGKLDDTTEYKKQADILSYRIGMTQNSLKGNALFDQNQYDQATQPLKMLSEELDKINKKVKDSDARKVASETEEKVKNIKNEIEEATKAIEKYEKAMQRVKAIQDKIDVGNLDGGKNSTQATLRSAQQRALEAKSEVDNLNLLRYRLPDEANASYANANALYADYMSENQNQERYLDNAADLYRNLIKYAEEYYGLVYKQDTGKTLTYNESKRLEYLDSLYKKAIDNADALQKKLSGEDVNLPDDAMAAADYAKQKPIMEQYESLGKTISKYGDVQGNKNYTTWLDSVNDRYKKIKMMIDSINWFPENDAQKDKLINDVKAVEDEIQKLQKDAKNERKSMAPSFSTVSETAKETLNRQMDQWISQNTAAKGAIQQIREYQRQLMSVTDKGALEKVKVGFEKVKREAIAAGETGLTFGEKLQKSMGNLARYLLSFVSFYRIVGTIKQGIEVVREMDEAMTDLKKVIDASEISFDNFRKNSYDIAREIGVTAQTIVSAASEWGKLGYNLEESTELAKSSAVYTNVGEVTPEAATSDLVSVLKAFNKEASDSIGIVDVLNNVSNKYAVSAAELGEILKKSSSALAVSGDTMENIVAMGSAMQAIVQDSSVVGSTLKIVSLRLRGATADLKEAGEETDGMATSTAKLRGQIMALTKNTSLGAFDIMRNPNEFLTTYQIIDGVASRWQDMAQVDQAALLELMAGRLARNIQKYIFMYTLKCVDCLIAFHATIIGKPDYEGLTS